MNALFKAITTKFKTTNDLNTALGGRMYPHEAVQGATFPYGVYFMISDFSDRDFTDEHEHISVQFSVFSEDDSVGPVGILRDKLTALFDDVSLTVTGYTSLYFKRVGTVLIRDEEMATWHYAVDYDCLLERAR